MDVLREFEGRGGGSFNGSFNGSVMEMMDIQRAGGKDGLGKRRVVGGDFEVGGG